MIITKVTRKLLQGLAITLAKYANSIEKYLAEKNLPDEELFSFYSHDEPPAHWLAKVRQGAPHLLDHTSHGREFDPFFDVANDHQAMQYTTSKHSKQQPTQHTSKNLLETIKKYIYLPILVRMRHSKNVKNNAVNLTGEALVAKYSHDKPPSHWLAKVRQGAPHLLDHASHGRELDPFFDVASDQQAMQYTTNKHSKQQSTQHTSKNLLETITKYIYRPTLAIVRHAKSTDNNPEILHQKPSKEAVGNFFNPISTKSERATDASLNLKKQETEQIKKIHLYPKSKTPASAAKATQYNHVNKPASARVKHIFLSDDRKPKIPDVLQQKVNTLPGNNRPKVNAYKLPLLNNNRMANTPDTQILDLRSKNFSQQHKADKFQSGSIQWPSLPDETVPETDQDRWPQLPKEDRPKSIDNVDNSLEFWQLQEQAQRNILSEQEQRGKFWSE